MKRRQRSHAGWATDVGHGKTSHRTRPWFSPTLKVPAWGKRAEAKVRVRSRDGNEVGEIDEARLGRIGPEPKLKSLDCP